MKPPPLLEILNTGDRSTNETLISPFADEWLKDLLRLAERGRQLKSPSDDLTLNTQILALTIELNGIANDALEYLQKSRTDKDTKNTH